MSDRIEEQRYQQARQIQALRNNDLKVKRLNGEFANKLLALSKNQPVPVQVQPPRQETIKPPIRDRNEKKAEDHKEKPQEEKSPRRAAEPGKKKASSKPEKKPMQNTESFLHFAAHLGAQRGETQPQVIASPTPLLPPELIHELVDKVERSRSMFGNEMLTIDLKAQVLSGAHIQVSVHKGQVRLRFSNTDQGTRALLRNSETAIHRRLEEKNLTLSDFEVH